MSAPAIRADQIKAIHTLKGKAGLAEPDYRRHLKERFRVVSSKQLSEAQASVLLDDLRALAPEAGHRPASRRASGKYAPILQALWLAAFHLDIVDKADDSALLAFVRRQTGVDHDRFLTDGAEAAKVIEALKAMMTREAGVRFATPRQAADFGLPLAVMNKRAVVCALAKKIQLGVPTFDLDSFGALERFPPIAACDSAQLDRLTKKLGVELKSRRTK